MDRITRKELKADKFALEVGHTVTFFEEHQKEIIRYGAVALVVAALVVGYMFYARRAHATRQAALYKAVQAQAAPVGPAPAPGALSFPTQEAKDAQTTKLFTEVRTQYSGSDEADIASYYLAAIHADQGKLAEAEKEFLQVAESGDAKYAALAKLSLAQIYFSDGRAEQGEKVLRELMDKPSVYVSRDQAALTLARLLAQKKPDEARRLAEELTKRTGPVGAQATAILGELGR